MKTALGWTLQTVGILWVFVGVIELFAFGTQGDSTGLYLALRVISLGFGCGVVWAGLRLKKMGKAS